MMDEMSRVFGIIKNRKVFFADPHDLERAKRKGRLFHVEDGLAFYLYNGITYVTPVDDPPMLRCIDGGRD